MIEDLVVARATYRARLAIAVRAAIAPTRDNALRQQARAARDDV